MIHVNGSKVFTIYPLQGPDAVATVRPRNHVAHGPIASSSLLVIA